MIIMSIHSGVEIVRGSETEYMANGDFYDDGEEDECDLIELIEEKPEEINCTSSFGKILAIIFE